MKFTSFCFSAILIVALANSEVRCYRISASSVRNPRPNEQNKITNSSAYSKISSTNLQPSDRKSHDCQELAAADKQDRSDIKSSTAKSQNSQQPNVNVSTGKGVADEHETGTQLGGCQNGRPSTSDKAYSKASDAQAIENADLSKSVAEYSSSTVAERTDNPVRTTIPTGFRAESTILTTEKWTSTLSTISTSTKTNSRLTTKPMSAGRFIPSTSENGSSTSVWLRNSFTTESSVTRANKSKGNGDAVVFPAATTARTTSKTATTQGLVTSNSGNRTTASVNTTVTIENKFIYDVPEFTCPEGEKKDSDKKCRKVL